MTSRSTNAIYVPAPANSNVRDPELMRDIVAGAFLCLFLSVLFIVVPLL